MNYVGIDIHKRYRPGKRRLAGSLLGGSASVATAWVTQRTSNKRKQFQADFTRREALYGQFISECSAHALHSYEQSLDKSEKLLSIYALLNRIRLCASDGVLNAAERALVAISEQYFKPNLSVEQMRTLIRDGAKADPLNHSPKLLELNSNRCTLCCDIELGS